MKRNFPGIHHSWRAARTLGYNVELGRVNSRNRARVLERSFERTIPLCRFANGAVSPRQINDGCLAMQYNDTILPSALLFRTRTRYTLGAHTCLYLVAAYLRLTYFKPYFTLHLCEIILNR